MDVLPEQACRSAIVVSHQMQLAHMRDPTDNWTGVTNPVERKKRQNRLNQRARRRRMMVQQVNHDRRSGMPQNAITLLPEPLRVIDTGVVIQFKTKKLAESRETAKYRDVDQEGHLLIDRPEEVARIRAHMQRAYEDYSLNAPKPAFLQLLIRLNVLNGLARNATLLGFPVEGLCRDEYISPFNYCGPRYPLSEPAIPLSTCPVNMRPTTIQRSITHHPWIDLLPFPALRENMLQGLLAEDFDEDELCYDLLEVQDGSTAEERPALVIWGAPWDVRGWEASVAFLKKWGWLVRGCPEILETTNYWRKQRGERTLNFGSS